MRGLLVTAALIWLVRPALAQAPAESPIRVGAGFVLAVDPNGPTKGPIPVTGNHTSVLPGGWASITWVRSPRVSFQFGVDWSTAFAVETRRPGSAGYHRDQRHRDTLLTQLLAFAPGTGKTGPTWLFGSGVVVSRTVGTKTSFSFFGTSPITTPIDEGAVHPALVAGVDVPVWDRAGVVLRARIKMTPRTRREVSDGFGWFGMSAGGGLQFRF